MQADDEAHKKYMFIFSKTTAHIFLIATGICLLFFDKLSHKY